MVGINDGTTGNNRRRGGGGNDEIGAAGKHTNGRGVGGELTRVGSTDRVTLEVVSHVLLKFCA